MIRGVLLPSACLVELFADLSNEDTAIGTASPAAQDMPRKLPLDTCILIQEHLDKHVRKNSNLLRLSTKIKSTRRAVIIRSNTASDSGTRFGGAQAEKSREMEDGIIVVYE